MNSMLSLCLDSRFISHVCVFLQQMTGTHAPKRGNGRRNATSAKLETQKYKYPTHRFIKLPPVLFMDSSCAQNMFASPVICSVSLNWEAHPCASYVNKTTRHLKQNGALPQRLFPQRRQSYEKRYINHSLQPNPATRTSEPKIVPLILIFYVSMVFLV